MKQKIIVSCKLIDELILNEEQPENVYDLLLIKKEGRKCFLERNWLSKKYL